ncbi:MAG: 2-phospho-L-lactate/phosphoenolpyruvate guanylyltransferase [Actinomycetota bacterium]|nr:2-phospho-L-lactate/phosphoenolpyruvate guanylyltransferase [Actinomycetota bacterium]
MKQIAEAKTRLGPHFDPAARAEIVRALIDDALALCTSTGFLSWWVVSRDPEVLSLARDQELNTILETGQGLNEAVAQAVAVIKEAGAGSMTVVPADIPLAWAGDLRDLLDTGATSDSVVVPAARGGGTNALYLDPPDLIAPRFGPSSLQAYLSASEAAGHRCSILSLPRLALDIDTIADVDTYLARPKPAASATQKVLERLRPAVPLSD